MATIDRTDAFHGVPLATGRAADASAATGGARRAGAGTEYRVLHALVFAVCLALAALARLVRPLRRRRAPRRTGLVAEARAAADSTVPYVFQVS